jgi:hypothetical protein
VSTVAKHPHESRRGSAGLLLVAFACCALGCGGGSYGHTRTYEPLISEKPHFDRAQELSYEQVKRAPYDYKATQIAWFGVVEKIEALPDGRTALRLGFRTHQARHLCKDEYQDSCRVTVSQTSSGPFVARLQLSDAEKNTDQRVWVGSLMKLYGTPTGDYDEHGDPVLEVSYHRHWPRGTYVTTAQRRAMKR